LHFCCMQNDFQRIKLFFYFTIEPLTQIINVLFILLVTVLFSVIATFLTILLDNVADIRGIIASIPQLTLYNSMTHEML
jgi:hypothetical protein